MRDVEVFWSRDENNIVYAVDSNGEDLDLYWIPPTRTRTSAEVLDWIAQIAHKPWISDTSLGRLVKVLDRSVGGFQRTLCGGGVEQGPRKLSPEEERIVDRGDGEVDW